MRADPASTPQSGHSLREQVSASEWQARVELAAAYRIAARLRWTDHLATHFSLRVPGEPGHFLLNAHGLTFYEIIASNLVKINADGAIVSDATGLGVNRAGFVIYSALHQGREDVHCVLHIHTTAGIAVAAHEHGLLMLSQHVMLFHGRLAYHVYEGVATELDEQAQLVRDLGPHGAMVLCNPGLLTAGSSVAEAFTQLYLLERACAAQVAALAGGASWRRPSEAAVARAGEVMGSARWPSVVARNWAAFLREQDRADPGYAT